MAVNVEPAIEPIGVIHTCFKEKFGIPRQPNLADKAPGVLEFFPEFARPEAVRGLEQFSHIWLIFVFHKAVKKGGKWSAMIRPPRLGGNKKVGVFASRSPFRPNPIGMSCVRLEDIKSTAKGPVLHLNGVDILDQTPVLDIKPYLPYSDRLDTARDGFAPAPDNKICRVSFSDTAAIQIKEREKTIPNLLPIITQVLENDPRPAYCRARFSNMKSDTRTDVPENSRVYGIRLFDFDLKWQAAGNKIRVLCLDPASD
ncbi:tRNA (N6-threonylcarbamoyladenosine(37)-N6)-methyltransferase TrmO [uncultured Desulfobacter sp.]|uniref:tRNA (N6-threonylcarbamoyladenosine(37)-N6)-methyltransferase TrmO n=1 Tax=uncultured Desulfobacter sp. TaxID=240139 RepID=UPI0029F4983F|nr:tRNA (N6-threonylcarbamoyladenosine(37)-N6)-methyltransferase TrmO [uncultured Desulfobacter sp.]